MEFNLIKRIFIQVKHYSLHNNTNIVIKNIFFEFKKILFPIFFPLILYYLK